MGGKYAKDAETGLTAAQEAFALAIVAGKNQSDAYRQAYPASKRWKPKVVHEKASTLAANGKVQERIQALSARIVAKVSAKTECSVERVLEEIARIALSDVGSLFTEDGALRDLHSLNPAERAAIASIEVEDEPRGRDANGDAIYVTVRKIKLWNKNDALEKIAKHLGLYREDNLQKQGIFDGLPTDDILAIQAFLFDLRNRRQVGLPAEARPTQH